MEPAEYHKMAAVEDDMWYYRALHGYIGRELSRHLGPGSARVLDAGCGTGGLVRRLAPKTAGLKLVGCGCVSPLACELVAGRQTGNATQACREFPPAGPEQLE